MILVNGDQQQPEQLKQQTDVEPQLEVLAPVVEQGLPALVG
ncbi:MAG: hypothetical protein OQK94_00345 [Gammaproteobacteria bacterium]|nr:hypothetical protein [Gammaproteobacteria bacterium]MCW8928533.1 hypothetical protein [Gammaproteobacteria bacterium]